MLIPRAKEEKRTGGNCLIPFALTVDVCSCVAGKLTKLLGYLLPDFAVSESENAVFTARKEDLAQEAYELSVKDGKIQIRYGDYLGLRNAVAALSVAAVREDDGYLIPEMEVRDQPVASHRGVMLDLARGMKDYGILCEDLVLIAKARMNVVHLHIFDSMGVCFRMESVPEHAIFEGCYSRQQMSDLCAMADVLGLEVIPEFDMPAHSTELIKTNPEYACELPEGAIRSDWTVCAGTEAVYEMYDRIIAEIAEIFPGKYIHVGGDELEFTDLGNDYLCHWNDCPKCARFREEHNIADRQDQLYYFTNRINAMVKKHGRQTMIWSDQIDCTREVKLDRDILLHFWRVAGKGRGPHEGCSMNGQLTFGFEMVNSYYPETYLDLEGYASSESLRTWHWTKIPEAEPQYHEKILGAELACWEYGNEKGYKHYDHSLPSGIFIMADKLWNGDDLPYSTEYAQVMSHAILGPKSPADLDVFACMGDLIPPRDVDWGKEQDWQGKLAYPEKVAVGQDELAGVLGILESLAEAGGADGRRAAGYAESVRYVLKNK